MTGNPRKLIHSISTTGYDIFSFTVPTKIGRQIPEGTKFHCRLTEEGILFTPHSDEDSPPKWVQDRQTSLEDDEDEVPVKFESTGDSP